ncbi:MAG: acetate--CoA ligase family protein [Deltaproteobacteria bacterium]|nr:acetate--CoA ligase family protein [Desulfitobacteriaceae bacterium]MDI6854621.1 acetate--CoA ligase family protein [Deltaproteobacteria bacterium]
MERFFYPRSVAVIGVSANPVNLAKGIVRNMREAGYQGKIYPVGPRGGTVYGLPILSHVRDLPEPADVAAILTPARFVPQVVEDCGKMGITRVVVESGGFSELGEQGKALEKEIAQLIDRYNIRLIGPNGLGVINMEIGLCLPFSQMAPIPRKGSISIISQSGGVGMHLAAWMTKEGLGLNKFVSLGNKLNVAENEILAYLMGDPGTEAVYLYLEGLHDGRELLHVARRAPKPVYVQIPNVGEETSAIAFSHTASLASDERVVEAACRQAGIIRVKSQADFLVAAKLTGQPLVKGDNLVVLSRSGGEAVIAAYACRQWGFKLPSLSPDLADFIHESSRSKIIKPTNPVDLGDIFDFSVYSRVFADLCQDPEVHAVLVNYGPVYDPEREEARRMARLMIEDAQKYQKPLAICVTATLEEEEFFRDELGFPVFHFPGQAVRALAYSRTLANRSQPVVGARSPWLSRDKIAALLADQPASGFLPMTASLSLITHLGIPVAGWQTATTSQEALTAAGDLGYPVCLKLAAPSLVHKTEVGGVILGLYNPEDVSAAFDKLAEVAGKTLPRGEAWEAVIMPQVEGGEEVIIGAHRDATFGPVIAFGAGGIWTEILEDVALRVAPIDNEEAWRLVLDTKIGQILQGARGRPAVDLTSLCRALAGLSQLMISFPQIQEVDLNPVRVFPGGKGILALDARIRVG